MDEEVMLDGPIPGQSLTAELGARPWQQPSQYSTVEEAIDYYVTRIESEEVTTQLLDVLEMGVPVTTVANAMQSSSVMEGKHTVDVGMLVLPVIIELISLIADAAKIKYTSGLEGDDRVRGSLVDKAVMKLNAKKDEKDEEGTEEEPENEMLIEEMKTAADERAGGLMARRNQYGFVWSW